MNILIVGEFSAFAKHLKNGFKKLGHWVTIVHTGDTFKKIESDEEDVLYTPKNVIIKGHHFPGSDRLLAPLTNRIIQRDINRRINGKHIDLVFVVNHGFLTNCFFFPGIRLSLIEELVSDGAKLIMAACGNDPALQYSYPDLCKMTGLRKQPKDARFTYLLKNSNAIIPTAFCYYDAVRRYCEHYCHDISCLCHAIPLPVTVDDDYEITSCNDRKIVIFHGVTRPQVKGTPYIKEAMERIQRDFPNKVECRCEGGMPYKDYVELFKRIDILIDQTYFNGWGVNAIIGAMKGKCVLTSCGPENSANMNLPCIPFVKIEADTDQIYQTLKNLIQNPDLIEKIKFSSREFAVKYCESSIIAQKYIDIAKL